MATIALRYTELQRIEEDVRSKVVYVQYETEYVAQRSGMVLAWRVLVKTLSLAVSLQEAVTAQQQLIALLQDDSISALTASQMELCADKLDTIVKGATAVIERAERMPARIRLVLKQGVAAFKEQTNHLDSIAESLHLAADPESEALLGLAADQVI